MKNNSNSQCRYSIYCPLQYSAASNNTLNGLGSSDQTALIGSLSCAVRIRPKHNCSLDIAIKLTHLCLVDSPFFFFFCRSMSNRRCVWLAFIFMIYYTNSCFKCKWSTLFVNAPFYGMPGINGSVSLTSCTFYHLSFIFTQIKVFLGHLGVIAGMVSSKS